MRTARTPVLLAVLVCLVGCERAPAPTSVPAPETVAARAFEQVPCWFDNVGAAPVTCAWLRPTRQDSTGTTALPVVVVPAVPGRRSDHAMVYLNGGPAQQSGFDDEGMRVIRTRVAMLGLRSDFVVYDQRGAGLSKPTLDCAAFDAASRDPEIAQLPSPERLERIWSTLEDCMMQVPAVDRRSGLYSTPTAVADLAELVGHLRSDLGYQQVSLYGGSYGTRLAIEAVQHEGMGIERLVLDSVQPPDAPLMVRYPSDIERILDDIDVHCAAGRCELPEGGIRELLRRASAQLKQTPYRTTVADPEHAGQSIPVRLDAEDLFSLVAMGLMIDGWGLSLVEILGRLAAGEPHPKIQAAAQLLTVLGMEMGVNMIGNLLINCADRPMLDAERMAAEQEQYPESAVVVHQERRALALCERAGIEAPAPAGDWHVELPTLLLSRRTDPLTPVHLIESALDHFTEAELLVVPGAGHGVADADPVIAGLAGQFLDGRIGPDDVVVRYKARIKP